MHKDQRVQAQPWTLIGQPSKAATFRSMWLSENPYEPYEPEANISVAAPLPAPHFMNAASHSYSGLLVVDVPEPAQRDATLLQDPDVRHKVFPSVRNK